jgi:CHAT domain-containing protein
LVFAVSRKGAAWADIGLTGDELEARIRRIRTQIDPRAYGLEPPPSGDQQPTPGQGAFDRQAAFELYRALLGDPAIQSVIAATPTLLVVPSGPLTSLPPGLLVTAAPQGGEAGDADQATLRNTPWLLRSKAIALLPSVSSLRTLRQLLPAGRAASPDPLLAFTNPDFSGGSEAILGIADRAIPRSLQSYYREGRPLADALRALPPLGGTMAEGEDLARALGAPPSAILTGREASKAELFARNRDGRLAKVRVIDFATHGLVAGDALGLVEPALALARGVSPEDGLLTASEAATLTLNADWVLLSACNTASPDATEAQGLSGLSRAFFHAGARSLLVSHWRVNDGITAFLVPEIMAAQQRNSRLSRAAALQRASLAVLDDRSIAGAHPAMWAPFTLVGEAGR